MRKALVFVGITIASVSFGAGLGSSAVLSSGSGTETATAADAGDVVRIADKAGERGCPYRGDADRQSDAMEETST